MERHVEWTSPAPLWSDLGDPGQLAMRRAFRSPAILRFARDEFMDEFLNLMATSPERLREYVAAPETWKEPPGEPIQPVALTGLRRKLVRARAKAIARLEARGTRTFALLPPPVGARAFKLFQPAHGRFYLLSACLVCREVGLPDRRIDTSAEEKVSFVVRLLRLGKSAAAVNPDPADCAELAYVDGEWKLAGDPEGLVAGEQQNPLAPLSYQETDGRKRRLLTALIPVSQRDKYASAAQPDESGVQPAPIDPRRIQLKVALFEPWQKLEASVTAAQAIAIDRSGGATPSPDQIDRSNATANDQNQAGSFYVLVDFGDWLEKYLKPVWDAVVSGGSTGVATQDAILSTLDRTSFNGLTFRQALERARGNKGLLERLTTRFTNTATDWPAFRFRFSTATSTGVTGLTPPLARAIFETQVAAALPPQSQPPSSLAAAANVTPQNPADWFTIRCVFERPNCPALSAPILSDPSSSFQMAAYFDPDAPARPIRIGLPVDTSAAGLRKFDKNTAFVMSDILCGQVGKLQGLTFGDLIRQVLPFPFHQDLPVGDMAPCPGGMVCSFSIPIITICAMILLLIIVKLLDIVFFWMPFFQICLPLPKFSAKGSS